jgi:hypothetical protein
MQLRRVHDHMPPAFLAVDAHPDALGSDRDACCTRRNARTSADKMMAMGHGLSALGGNSAERIVRRLKRLPRHTRRMIRSYSGSGGSDLFSTRRM